MRAFDVFLFRFSSNLAIDLVPDVGPESVASAYCTLQLVGGKKAFFHRENYPQPTLL